MHSAAPIIFLHTFNFYRAIMNSKNIIPSRMHLQSNILKSNLDALKAVYNIKCTTQIHIFIDLLDIPGKYFTLTLNRIFSKSQSHCAQCSRIKKLVQKI